MTVASVYDAVRRHYSDFRSGRKHKDFEWTAGPMAGHLPEFRIRRIEPKKRSDPWVYATVGAWQATDGADSKEFFLLSPAQTPEQVETLVMVAYFHADPKHRLKIGSTVNIGRPWMGDAQADHLLVSLPYPYGPILEHCDADGTHIQVLWLVPITASEAAYRRAHGLEALEQLLENDGVDMISPRRPSLA
ncbi:suppressor of fused domain protein [Actinophytocola sp.]|uniref:suppressor of fused domain protein n=1 Tax=Actinophytocola sp. TaxID=1872138 RepID=UPI002D4EF319|nr:suppressor of fused domain protein [Actinophytocola sp.]HYQ62452.1 suppressor of fused domain protein [Actinophytocola sp.]